MPFFKHCQEWVRTKMPIPKVTVQELFEKRARRCPNRIALCGESGEISYGELNARANLLARRLKREGVGPDTIVGLLVRRSPSLFIGMLGILKAGGAYLPVDPLFPRERIAFMLKDSGTAVLAGDPGLYDPSLFDGPYVDLRQAAGNEEDNAGQADRTNLSPQSRPQHLAYVIYTSGSTGVPKGVMIEHRSVVNLIEGVSARIDFSPDRTMIAQTTMSFDIFVLESLLPLVKGMKIAIAGEAAHLSHRVFNETLLRHGVDTLQITPTRMRQALQSGAALDGLAGLRTILLGGEALQGDLVERLRSVTSARLYNMYGPTETTVWSTLQEVADGVSVTIGTPIANTRVYILDDEGKLLPPESTGELCIAGDGVARGYINRPALQDEKFREDPFVPGARMYKTGDLARWNRDYRLEALGRLDDMVKINGNTVHLGEIEHVILQSGLVQAAAVTSRETPGGGCSLTAYYVAEDSLPAGALVGMLAAKLPGPFIPAEFKRIGRMPVMPSGKLDKRALAAQEEGGQCDGQ
ncbi:amino acid adenylation domain-containing protein [Paenibacillus chitinolyticus]|uniref:amino acid adenylation domain-containing protein n=1 Tax=Paenibacillus chitinolyticus TaxID=79263 RepID=UPI002DBB0A33|nr:amino acid adenylation domain-containing protein [Paenibacillus chitinolyticus]MEC0248507.1 amino acid adenylation domain-containing protein [Paenibacillus chitinolyticus]